MIEDTAAGIQLIQEYRTEGFVRIVGVKPHYDKTMRMAMQTPVIEAGRVYLPREAPWLNDYLHELAMFPKGKFDDQVDSTAQALAHIGMPNRDDGMLEYMRREVLKKYRLTQEDLTVTFDHAEKRRRFEADSGRNIYRELDGFYHVTQDEWDTIKDTAGLTLIAS